MNLESNCEDVGIVHSILRSLELQIAHVVSTGEAIYEVLNLG